MKRITFFLLLLPYFAIAQRELQSDTMWLTKQLITAATDTTSAKYEYFMNRRYDYTNGESVTQKLLLGDSATAINAITGQEIDAIRNLAEKAATVIGRAEIIRDWQQAHTQTDTIGIGSMAAVIQGLFEEYFIKDVTVRNNGVTVDGEIKKLANNSLRLTLTGKNYRVFVFADTMIRLLNYPDSGQNTDLYKINNNLFSDINKQITLRLKQNR